MLQDMIERNRYNDLIVEIMETERLFCEMAAEKGLKEAFLAFAAKEVVISRNNRIYAGKAGIEEFYGAVTSRNISLKWKPDYVDVADSEDMAWTYGKYTYSALNESGEPLRSEGIFHTVWRKQPDGSWKYVWD